MEGSTVPIDAENVHYIRQEPFRVFNKNKYKDKYKLYMDKMPDFYKLHNTRTAGNASEENESTASAMAFQGTMQVYDKHGKLEHEITGSGHHGRDYVGVASVRAGKGINMGSMMSLPVNNVKIM